MVKFVGGHHWAKAGCWMIIGGIKAASQWASHGPNPRQGLLPLARGTREVRTLAVAVANPPFSLPKDKGFSEWFECVSELFVLFNL